MTRIYVELMDERVEVYRPVEATALPGGLFRITTAREATALPGGLFRITTARTGPDEAWRFETGTVVRCRRMRLQGGEHLVAVEELAMEVSRDT